MLVVQEAHMANLSDLDSIDPSYTLFAGHAPPFTSDRWFVAAVVRGYGLPEYGGHHEREFGELRYEHVWR